MRQTHIIISSVLVTAIVATLGVTVINAKSSRQATITPVSSSVDAMQMMTSARDLPEQRYDAY